MTRFTSVVVLGLCSAASQARQLNSLIRIIALGTLLTLSVFNAKAQADTGEAFRISANPDEAPTELIRKFEPLANYLSDKLDRPVTFIPVTDYAAAVEALTSEQIDMAWLGGFTYIQAAQRSDGKVEPIVQRAEDEHFQSVFITQSDSDIQSISDLKDVTFSFGSPSSTSGHLMPRHFLTAEGIDVDNELSVVTVSIATVATVLAIVLAAPRSEAFGQYR